jgi:hypothetical protein
MGLDKDQGRLSNCHLAAATNVEIMVRAVELITFIRQESNQY